MPFDITNHFFVSLAYKAAVLHGMVSEGNFAAQHLKLPEPIPIEIKQIKANVNPPLRGGLGSFETHSFFYSFPGSGDQVQVTNANGTRFPFPERGKLAYIERKNPFAQYGGSLLDSQDQLAKLPCLMDTNAAYTLATQWLAAISIDVPALESKYKSLSLQQAYCSPPLTPEEAMRMPLSATNLPPGHKWVSLPIFDITWGGKADDSPPVWVQIFGATKELLRIRMEDTSFSRRPPLTITNALELNTRPDPPAKQIRPGQPYSSSKGP